MGKKRVQVQAGPTVILTRSLSRWFLIVVFFILTYPAACRSQTIDGYRTGYIKAITAFNQGDYRASLKHYDSLLSLTPNNPRILYQKARCYAFLGDDKSSMETLSRIISMDIVVEAAEDTAFQTMLHAPEFAALLARNDELKKLVSQSAEAFTIDDPALIPEGIVFDEADDRFFLGSIPKFKIIRSDEQGRYTDFTDEKSDGLRKVLGLRIDHKRRILWAASILNSPAPPGIDESEIGWSGIFKYDLRTGKLIKKYTIHEPGKSHLLNDLAVTQKGDVYITDSDEGTVYRILKEKDILELFIKPGHFIYPNGIALSDDEAFLYVASMGTVKRVDISSGRVTPLKTPDTVSMYGIDGLYLYKHTLIAVQNGLMRLCRFYLNEEGDSVVRADILEMNNPELNVPTTGTIAGDTFYYIANCNFGAFNPDGSLIEEKLEPVRIFKIPL